MTVHRVSNFGDFFSALEEIGSDGVVYRGVKQTTYELIPKLGRMEIIGGNVFRTEKILLKLFKDYSRPYLKHIPQNDLEWLALAQHHGLPTRLLDWTRNPLVAAYFAVHEEFDGDSLIYCYRKAMIINVFEGESPFEIKRFGFIFPAHLTNRITAQAGLFSIHHIPNEALMNNNVLKIVITKNFRGKMKKQLSRFGINHSTIFPDLDGLSTYLTWLHTKIH